MFFGKQHFDNFENLLLIIAIEVRKTDHFTPSNYRSDASKAIDRTVEFPSIVPLASLVSKKMLLRCLTVNVSKCLGDTCPYFMNYAGGIRASVHVFLSRFACRNSMKYYDINDYDIDDYDQWFV